MIAVSSRPSAPLSPACGLSPATASRGRAMPKRRRRSRADDPRRLDDQLRRQARGDCASGMWTVTGTTASASHPASSPDAAVVAPAVAALAREGIAASGPHPADTMFHAAARAGYDAALCMYHDQALIPLKTLDFDEGVNVTLGLPIVRTSPDHGTAFDIAGKGIASPDSLVAALRLAGTPRGAAGRDAPREPDRQPAAAARGHARGTGSRRRRRSARTSCSTST